MNRDVSGSNNPNWKGGRKIDRNGYYIVLKPDHPFCGVDRYVPEHRLVMEADIGRYLDPEEKVHHRNGIKTDNRIENLQLFESHSKHFRTAHGKKDKNRICLLCESNTTYKDKRGYQFWTKYEDGHICSRCSYKLFMPKRRKKVTIS